MGSMRLNMVIYANSLKKAMALLFGHARHAVRGLCQGARPLLFKKDYRAQTEIERRAEDDRRSYVAQALAAGWQGLRYLR
jgi:hypothetical protein